MTARLASLIGSLPTFLIRARSAGKLLTPWSRSAGGSVTGTGAIGRTHQMGDVVESAAGPDAIPQASPASRLGHQGQTRQGQ